MQHLSLFKNSFLTMSLLLLSGCSSESTDVGKVASYYITPFPVYDVQASLGESDVQALGNLHQSSQNPLHTGIDTIHLEMEYDSQDYSDNLDEFGKWRHSYSQSMDQYNNIDYESLDIKSIKYTSKEDVCVSGFEEIKDYAYNAAFVEAISVFDAMSDTCVIRSKKGELLLKLPIFSTSERQLFHMITHSDGETSIFVPSSDGNFVSTTDPRVTLKQKASEWELTTSDDTLEVYGADGTLLSVQSQGLALKFAYDSEHHLVEIEDAFANIVSFEYDEVGAIALVRNSKDDIVNHFKIEEGRLKAVYLSRDDTQLELFTVEYEAAEKLSALHYEEGGVSFFYTYNDVGQVTHKTLKDADNNVLDEMSFSYTPQSMSIHDADNSSTEIRFKMMASSLKTLSVTNRIETRSATLNLAYDADGFLQKLETSDFVTTLKHNVKGLITSIANDHNLSIDFGYDAVHNRPTQVIQGGQIQTIIYNELGAIVASLKETLSEYISRGPSRLSASMTHYNYDNSGRLLSVTSADGVQRSASFTAVSGDLRPSVFDDTYETVLSSWNTDYNEAKPHSEKYYKNSNVKYYDWVVLDKPGFEATLKDKKYIFIGYSYGADSILELSTRDLSATPNVEVDLTITIDPVGWIPTFEPVTKEWINVTAQTAVKTLKSGHFEYVGRKWGIPRYKWVKTVKTIPILDESDLLAASGGKKRYLPLIDGAGNSHEQINYTGHHTSFNCMLAEVSNRYPEIGLFKVNADDTRAGKVISNCNMGSGAITLID